MKENLQKKEKKRFPTLAVILLALGLTWFLNDLSILALNLPWIPLVLIIIAIGIIINRYN